MTEKFKEYKQLIDLWWNEENLVATSDNIKVIDDIFDSLSNGVLKVVSYHNNQWHTNQWVKKAILLAFRLKKNQLRKNHGFPISFDKLLLKWEEWNADDFAVNGFRMLPGAIARAGSYIAKNTILMPCFINVGAYINEGTMIDTWSTIGSCAYIGKNCHISGGVGIGGVLEPVQANPVIIEDECFIGARSEIAEGVIVEKGSVVSMGVFIGASTKIIDRASKQIFYGRVPPYSVVVPGTLPSADSSSPSLACAVIVKQVDEKTRAKTSINDLLRY